jgi:hypothetical protein
MDGTLPRIVSFEKYIVGGRGLLLHPRAGWGLIFWTMSFYNPKKLHVKIFLMRG